MSTEALPIPHQGINGCGASSVAVLQMFNGCPSLTRTILLSQLRSPCTGSVIRFWPLSTFLRGWCANLGLKPQALPCRAQPIIAPQTFMIHWDQLEKAPLRQMFPFCWIPPISPAIRPVSKGTSKYCRSSVAGGNHVSTWGQHALGDGR